MFEYLHGTLTEKGPMRAVIDVHGVGYEVRIPVSTFSKLPALESSVKLLIHYVVREDAQLLYGFSTAEERELFRLLISISGIGPKLGITILSGMTFQELRQAIAQGDVQTLTAIPGIGKKTAERVVVELREKISVEEMPAGSGTINLNQDDAILNDSLSALLELGYKKKDGQAALQRAAKDLDQMGAKPTVSDFVRKALKYVGRGV